MSYAAQIAASFDIPPLIIGSGPVNRHPVQEAYERGWLDEPRSAAAARRGRRLLPFDDDR